MGTTITTQSQGSVQSALDAAYWASQPPPVAALQSMQVDIESPTPGGRTQTAMALAKQGYIIDVDIMIYGWDAYLMMSDREEYGFAWVESALQQPPTIAPGVSQPGAVPYNPNNPPAGSIKVSTNIADYTPFVKPTPAPTVTELVGAQILPGVNQYYPAIGDTSPVGKEFTDARGKFEKFATPTSGPFGVQGGYWFWWELVTPAAT